MYNALVGVKPVDIITWSDFKAVCRQLKQAKKSDDPNISDMYRTIIVDTVPLAYTLCEKHIIAREGISSISDLPYGKGYQMVKTEFEDTFRELTQLGYGIVFICHSKTKQTEYTDEDGNAIEAIAPDMTNSCYQIVNRMVDLIGYIAVEYDMKTGQSHRYIYTRGTPRVFAGSRYKYLAPKIELGYQQLVDAIAEAMKKEAEMTGTSLDNRSVSELLATTTRPFSDVMNEARGLWKQIIDAKGDEGREAMREAIQRVFKRDVQLSKVTEDQQELVELVIDDFKKIL